MTWWFAIDVAYGVEPTALEHHCAVRDRHAYDPWLFLEEWPYEATQGVYSECELAPRVRRRSHDASGAGAAPGGVRG